MKDLTTDEIVNLKCGNNTRYFIIISSKEPQITDNYVGKYVLVQKEVDHCIARKGQTLTDNDFIETYFAKLDGCGYRPSGEGWILVKSMAVTDKEIRVFEIE